jgi:hypothetical protein
MSSENILLPKVLLLSQSLFYADRAKYGFEGTVAYESQTGKQPEDQYEAAFVLDNIEHKAVIASLRDRIKAIEMSAFRGKAVPTQHVALKDGSAYGSGGLCGKMVLEAWSKKRPLVVNRAKTPLTESNIDVWDMLLNKGVYVNGIIYLWAESNSWGIWVNSGLLGVQYL